MYIQIMSSGNADVRFFSTNIYTTNKINNAKITRLLMSLSCNKCAIQLKRNEFDLKENSLYIAFGFFFLKTSMAVSFALLGVMIIIAIFDLHLFIIFRHVNQSKET